MERKEQGGRVAVELPLEGVTRIALKREVQMLVTAIKALSVLLAASGIKKLEDIPWGETLHQHLCEALGWVREELDPWLRGERDGVDFTMLLDQEDLMIARKGQGSAGADAVRAILDEALNSGSGVYRP